MIFKAYVLEKARDMDLFPKLVFSKKFDFVPVCPQKRVLGNKFYLGTGTLFWEVSLREADWFDILFETSYLRLCEKDFTESLILAQDERWRHA